MKKPTTDRTVIARVPDPLIKKLDAAAKRGQRTRSAEIRIRLEESLARASVVQTSIVPLA